METLHVTRIQALYREFLVVKTLQYAVPRFICMPHESHTLMIVFPWSFSNHNYADFWLASIFLLLFTCDWFDHTFPVTNLPCLFHFTDFPCSQIRKCRSFLPLISMVRLTTLPSMSSLSMVTCVCWAMELRCLSVCLSVCVLFVKATHYKFTLSLYVGHLCFCIKVNHLIHPDVFCSFCYIQLLLCVYFVLCPHCPVSLHYSLYLTEFFFSMIHSGWPVVNLVLVVHLQWRLQAPQTQALWQPSASKWRLPLPGKWPWHCQLHWRGLQRYTRHFAYIQI